MATKLDPRVKEAWVGALLSGEYKQGARYLHNKNDEFCCLGVLCDVLGMDWSQAACTPWSIGGDDGGLSINARESVGLSTFGRLNKPVDGWSDLAALNDNADFTFEQIAHVIMEQF